MVFARFSRTSNGRMVETTCLIIDDSEGVRNRLIEGLSSAQVFDRFITAEDGLEGFRKMRSEAVDLVLCDLDMPAFDGFKFLRMKCGDPSLSEVPVILLTGREDVDSKVRGLSAGASDYLTKPFDQLELIARVNVHMNLKRLRDELREKNEELERLARTDELTGVANRRYLMECLEQEFARSQRYQRPFSLLMADLDHFKRINDSYGHQVGDDVLVRTAAAMRSTLRQNDIVGRYGGEEFALMLPETEVEGALTVAERCRQMIEELVVEVQGVRVPVTASLGLATNPSASIASVDALMRVADGALYEAKRAGRNRVVAASVPEAGPDHP